MPLVNVEYRQLLQVGSSFTHPPHTLHTPSTHPPHTLRTRLSAPSPRSLCTAEYSAPPLQAARRNPTSAPAILLPGLRTFATIVTWRLSSLTGVGDRRAIMDSFLCQAAYTVASCRAQASARALACVLPLGRLPPPPHPPTAPPPHRPTAAW